MSTILRDGSVAAKYFSPHGPILESQSQVALRMGHICATYYPTDPGNISKTFVEYDVLTDYVDRSGIYSTRLFPRCKVVSLFGGAADFTFFTYRESTIDPSQLNNLETGSLVLLLCVNGDGRQGMIIGGLPHNLLSQNPNFQNLALAPGTNYVWEFNGAVINVNDAGELTLTFNGKTTNTGAPDPSADPNASGSTISMTQDGSISMVSPDMLQQVMIDNTNSVVNIDADEGLNVFCSGQATIQTAGVLTGAATDQTMLGSTYRLNETIMNTEITALTNTLTELLTTAGAALATAGSLLTAISLTSAVGAPITQAGAAITAASAALEAWGEAIQTFEDQSEVTPYLSDKNFSD